MPSSRKEAKALKATHYFTGKPCKNGHIAPRGVWGRCVECYRESWSNPDNKKLFHYTREYYRENPHKRLVQCAKVRAKRRGLEFTLTFDDVVIPETCPILGIKLQPSINKRMQDTSPSIDRIDSSKGYTPDNIVVVSWRANRLKSNATPKELQLICDFYNN